MLQVPYVTFCLGTAIPLQFKRILVLHTYDVATKAKAKEHSTMARPLFCYGMAYNYLLLLLLLLPVFTCY
jgi:hypothetical protein